MSFKTKTAEKKGEILKSYREGLPVTAIADKTGLDRHTISRVINEREDECKNLPALTASASLESAISVEEAKIAHVAQLARHERYFQLFKEKFDEVGLALVDPNFESTRRVVSMLKMRGWSEFSIANGASWLAVISSHPAFSNCRNPQGRIDSKALWELFSSIGQMRDLCANNNMDIASLMKSASQLVELRALGISTTDIMHVSEIVNHARSTGIEPQRMIREYRTLLDTKAILSKTEDEIMNRKAELARLESEIDRRLSFKLRLDQRLTEEMAEAENLENANRAAIRSLMDSLGNCKSRIIRLREVGDRDSEALAQRLGISLLEAEKLLSNKNKMAIVEERLQENSRIIDYALNADISHQLAVHISSIFSS